TAFGTWSVRKRPSRREARPLSQAPQGTAPSVRSRQPGRYRRSHSPERAAAVSLLRRSDENCRSIRWSTVSPLLYSEARRIVITPPPPAHAEDGRRETNASRRHCTADRVDLFRFDDKTQCETALVAIGCRSLITSSGRASCRSASLAAITITKSP